MGYSHSESGFASVVVVDTSFVYAMGGPETGKYSAVSTYATRTDTVFYLPPQVFDECQVSEAENYVVVPQVERGQSDTWMVVRESLDYQAHLHNGMTVSTIIDRVRAKMATLRVMTKIELRRQTQCWRGLRCSCSLRELNG